MKKGGVVVRLEMSIVSCVSCGHVRVDPRIADAQLDDLYDAAYYRGEGFDRTIDYEAPTTPETRATNDAIIDTVADALGGSVTGVRWLDVGCGAGSLLEAARERGALAFGTDASTFAVEVCKRKGLSVTSDTELADADPKSSFDVVSAIEVIEHVPDPKALLGFLRSCVRPGGVVYVGTGNWNLVRRQPATPYVMPEGHIQYFTPDTMRRLFAELGLREANVLNRLWFVSRLLQRRVKVVPLAALRRMAAIAQRVTPGIAPFPVGIR